MPPKRKKASSSAKKPPSRKRDEPDPSLILEGKRTRKQSNRAQGSDLGSTVVTEQARARVSSSEFVEGTVTARNKKPLSRIDEEPEPMDGSDAIIEILEVEGDAGSDLEHVPEADTDSSLHDSDFDLNVTEVPPELKKPKTVTKVSAGKKGKKSNNIQARDIETIHFQVPHRKANGQEVNKFIDVDYSDDYETVSEHLYKAIGCLDISKSSRPELVCHFSKDKQSQRYDLQDWTYIKKIYVEEVNKKGFDDALIEIILPKKFLDEITLARKHKGGRNMTGNVVDKYFGDQAANGDSEQIELTPEYKAWERKLMNELLRCSIHGADKFCKIDKYNEHRKVSSEQVRVWTLALMNPTRHPDVSILKPPLGDLFEPWRVDMRPLQDAIPRRNNARAGSSDPNNLQNLPQINLYFGNKKGQIGMDSSSPEDKQTRGRSPSPTDNLNGGKVNLTVHEFLEALPSSDLALIDIDVIKGKFIAEGFLDSPLSWLKALPKAELKSDFGFTTAEKGWLCNALDNEGSQQHRSKRTRYN